MSTSRGRDGKGGRGAKAGAPARAEPYHHGDLRAALLKAAGKVLEAQGPEALSLRDIARQIGVSHNAPYRHFATREALLGAVATEGFRELGAAMARARAGAGGGTDSLDRMGLAYIEFALERPQRFRLMFGGAKGQSSELDASAKAAFVALGGAAGTRFGSTPNLAAVRAWAFVHGIAHLLLDRQIKAVLMGGRTPLQFAALLLDQAGTTVAPGAH